MLALDLYAQLFHHQAHFRAEVLLGVDRRHREVAFLVADFIAQVRHLVPAGIPIGFLRINRVERPILFVVETHVVENEKLRFRTKRRRVG